jgi:hypothetical protein
MAKGNSDLSEQALNKAVETGLSSQLDGVENLEAEVHTNPIALMQGELESANIEGEGLVMKRDLRTEKLSLQTDGIAIDPLKAAFGNIELKRPTKATAVVTLTEADIQQAFNGEYIHQKLQNLEVKSDGQPKQVNVQHVKFKLPGQGKVAIAADVTVSETGESQHLSFSAVPEVGPQGNQVLLNNVQVEDQEAPEALTHSLLEAARELLDLRNFALPGMALSLQTIDIQTGKMLLQTKARVEEFPES